MKKLKFLPIMLVAISITSSCDNDPKEVNEEEVITTVTTTLMAGTTTIILKSKDVDGDGPTLPVVSVSGDLKINTRYTGTTTFMNELKTPAENITNEIKEEGIEHQLFYQVPAAIGAFTYTDKDSNNRPLGLEFELRTGAAAATGALTVTLKHKPNKSAAGVNSGDIKNAGGSTDAEVSFPVKVVL
jgi:hypothetical protein